MADSVTTPTDKTGRQAYVGEDSGFGERYVHWGAPKAPQGPYPPRQLLAGESDDANGISEAAGIPGGSKALRREGLVVPECLE